MCGAVQIEERTIRPYKIAIRQMNNNQPTPRVAAMHRNYERTNGSAAVPVLGFRGCIIQGDSSAFLRGTVFGDGETGLEWSLYCSHPFHRRRTQIGRIACDGKKQLHSLERRLTNLSGLQQYIQFIRKYNALGHMSKVNANSQSSSESSFYLPYHLVVKANSTTTKLHGLRWLSEILDRCFPQRRADDPRRTFCRF